MDVTEAFYEVYEKFKMHFYREVFRSFGNREATLTTVETFCMEVIYAMGRPTINEFASFIQISPPNAAYKVNNMIKKGYVRKVQSQKDKREYYLEVTQKYIDYYNISCQYQSQVFDRLKTDLTREEQEFLRHILETMSRKLMPEVPQYHRPGRRIDGTLKEEASMETEDSTEE
ncbi:MAG: MarR family winged helix-turn-helix transcriptional regulator [Lachnospiraceae bacterium]|uniref:MarR family winged helix-turn-helix transcriptional regulator n=1 Tax=Clostridium sp. (strain SY8519) TaxID=1042156 RepID=UPI000217198E|nr:MarR family winged helix-turn-helix transcriptional regulator [Lachnospiraceae bacterium]BAK46319.1 hypothetical protein CXIVA_03520 [Clostridium sp. SY8519]